MKKFLVRWLGCMATVFVLGILLGCWVEGDWRLSRDARGVITVITGLAGLFSLSVLIPWCFAEAGIDLED
jgi:hypothetical protein